MKRLTSYWPEFIVALLWTLGFALSCSVSTVDATASAPLSQSGATSLTRLVAGGTRNAFSASFYQVADTYFHRGVPHLTEKLFEDSPFQRAATVISPVGHAHRHGEEVEEMMPWLWLAVRADTHNVEAYRVTAFWLATDADRPDLAHEVLQEAHRNNPRSYQVRIDMARLELKRGNRQRATDHLDAALRLWPLNRTVNPELAALERAEILLYLGLLHEADGNRDDALRLYDEIARSFPDRHLAAQRVETLRRDETPRVAADVLLDRLVVAQEEWVTVCDAEIERGHDHHAHVHDESCRDGCVHDHNEHH